MLENNNSHKLTRYWTTSVSHTVSSPLQCIVSMLMAGVQISQKRNISRIILLASCCKTPENCSCVVQFPPGTRHLFTALLHSIYDPPTVLATDQCAFFVPVSSRVSYCHQAFVPFARWEHFFLARRRIHLYTLNLVRSGHSVGRRSLGRYICLSNHSEFASQKYTQSARLDLCLLFRPPSVSSFVEKHVLRCESNSDSQFNNGYWRMCWVSGGVGGGWWWWRRWRIESISARSIRCHKGGVTAGSNFYWQMGVH